MPGIRRFISELRRRRVIKVSIAYAVASWLLIEISSIVFPALLLPDWAHRMVVILAMAGFPVVVVLAWVFDISDRGIERTSEVAQTPDSPAPAPAPAALPPAMDTAIASISVMPFEVLSADPEDKFLAQGVCAEVYSALSKLSGVRVVPQTVTVASSQDTDIVATGARLGAQYLLTGNLRRTGDKIRIIVALADTHSGSQVWSQTYRRVLDDVMQIEEDIAGAIVGSFGGEHLREQIKRANQGETKNPTAWSLVHKARSYVLNYSRETLQEAERFARQALKLDPQYAAAHATLADVLCEQVTNGLSDDPDAMLAEAVTSIGAALAKTPDDPFVLKLAGAVWKLAGRHDDAIDSLRRAVEISAFDLGAWGYLGGALASTDNPAQLNEAHEVLDRVLDMAPQHPGAGFWLHHKALAFTCQEDYESATEYAKRALQKQPGLAWAMFLLANAQAMTGDTTGANATLARAETANAHLSAAKFAVQVRRTSASAVSADRRLCGLIALGKVTNSQ